jgi:hypothetical protein
MQADLRRCMEALDVPGMRALWAKQSPHLDQPKSDEDALVALHMARTGSEFLAFKHRAYSHAWLSERGLPSQLPDRLKPRAERLYPRAVSAVGISFRVRDPLLKPAYDMIRGAMEGAVLEADADGRIEDSPFVKARMNEAKDKERRALFGRFGLVKVGAV